MAYLQSAAQIGLGSTFSVNTGTNEAPVWTVVSELISFLQEQRRAHTEETTNLASSAAEYITTLVENGSYLLVGNYVSSDAGQQALANGFRKRLLLQFRVDVAGTEENFPGFVEEWLELAAISTTEQIQFAALIRLSNTVTVLSYDVPAGSPSIDFVGKTIIPWTHALGNATLFAAIWNAAGQPIGFNELTTQQNEAIVLFNKAQSGTAKVCIPAFAQAFTAAAGATVTVTHGLNSLNVVPAFFGEAHQALEVDSFALASANSVNFRVNGAQSGFICLLSGGYSQNFDGGAVTVAHGLASQRVAVAAYDSANSLIGFDYFTPISDNSATLTLTSSQSGRVVVALV